MEVKPIYFHILLSITRSTCLLGSKDNSFFFYFRHHDFFFIFLNKIILHLIRVRQKFTTRKLINCENNNTILILH